MAGNCKPLNESGTLLNLLPSLPSYQQLVDFIYSKVEEVKVKYLAELTKLLLELLDFCPPPLNLNKIIKKRNNLVESLNKLYNTVDKTSSVVSGINTFLQVIATVLQVAGGVVTAAILIQLVIPIIPAPVLAKLTGGTTATQETIKKIQFKSDGEPRLLPLIEAVTSASVAIGLFANVLGSVICKLEALDLNINSCLKKNPTKDQTVDLIPLSPELVAFVTQANRADQSNLLPTEYKGFVFELEEVPFSPTVNQTRAVAKNKDGIILLQTELSFTSTPEVLLQELQFIIDRDNLRAD
jgi:hypothetical protein